MVKAKAQAETQKPKFQQTKLCFSAFSSGVNKEKPKPSGDYAKKLEESIKELNISTKQQLEQHGDPCKNCNKTNKRIKCTALNQTTKEECNISYCTKCIEEKVNESVEWIKNIKEEQFVYKNEGIIQHAKSKPKWACLVCRGLCDCKMCLGLNQKLLFNIETTKTAVTKTRNRKSNVVIRIEPPELTPINLLYSEQEIWIRLQIREFIFRFGDIYEFENRLLTSLQNVQGDWRIKKFGAYIVWKFMTILYNTTQYELLEGENEESIHLLVKNTFNGWIDDKKLNNLYNDKEEKHHAFLQILNTEGMTGRRWQDIAEILALAQVKDIPVPNSGDIKKDNNMMEIDENKDDDEINIKIARYQKSNNRNLLSVKDELKMINMLLELLLYDIKIRQSLVAAGQKTMTKELRDEELEFKKFQKDWIQENMKNLLNRTSLANRVNQLKVTKGKEQELYQAQIDLDTLETIIRDENQNLSKRKLELMIHLYKAEKRIKPLGYDMLGNEYWIFNDTLDHLNNATDYRNSEPYWAYGIVIIGPGFKENQSQWWSLHGKNNLKLLKDWIINESKKYKDNSVELKKIAQGINDRINYLASLETVVYGEGFFQ